MTTPATIERRRFADLLGELGPDEPTLCEGWTTRDLAAHVVLRDRRPDAAIGILWSKAAGYTDRVQSKIAARPWTDVVDQVRSGPPIWSPTRIDLVDRLANTAEFFVHHEDVRRARPNWAPRELDPDLDDDLASALERAAKLLGRRSPVGLVLEPDRGRHRITAHAGTPQVVVRGRLGELVLWIYGRQDHARVSYSGDDEAVDAVRAADFGL